MGNFLNIVTGRKALIERAERAEARSEGRFYSTIHQVWEHRDDEFSNKDLDAIRRPKPHIFYSETIKAAESKKPWPAYNSGRSESDLGCSLDEDQDDTSTEALRKRKLKEIAIDGQDRDYAEVAHLIPFSSNCAHFYAPLVEAAVGVNVRDDTSLQPAKKKRKQQVLVHGQYEKATRNSTPRRTRDTGVKHCRTNMARVVFQKLYLDFHPSMLILPLLTLDETLDYKGGKYNVLVACTSPKVYVATSLQLVYDLCREDEVATATTTLSSFVRAAAFTLQLANRTEISKKLRNPENEKNLSTKEKLASASKVKVPVMKTTTSFTTIRLAKFTLDMKNKDAHQECDPFLLFVKAAVVWSSIQGQKLLPGCPRPHECAKCLEQGLFECVCDAYDPYIPIPEEIDIVAV